MSAIITERDKNVAELRQAEKENKLDEEINHPDCVCGNTCEIKDNDDECWYCDGDVECDMDCVIPFFHNICLDCLAGDICDTCGENDDAELIDDKFWCCSCREKDDDKSVERDLSVPALIPVAVVIDLTEKPVICDAVVDLGLSQDVINWLELIRKNCNEKREENKDDKGNVDKDFNWETNVFNIECLDGILVNINIRVLYDRISLIIESDHITDLSSGDKLVFNSIDLTWLLSMGKPISDEIELISFKKSFIKINEVLREYKFDKIQCCFEDKATTKNRVVFYAEQNKMELALAFVFENNTNLKERKQQCQECCVCYEKTKILTGCNHSLCVCCWDKLEEVEDEEMVRKCPICREILYI